MKLILHMGIPKTGTTSLQVGLETIAEKLAEHGFLYPDSPATEENFHHILTAFFGDWDYLKPNLRRRLGTIENAIQQARKFLAHANSQAIRKNCHTVILSSELLYPGGERNIRLLREHLEELATDIQPVIYVREPAALYKSRLQQASKSCAFMKPYPLRKIRPQLTRIGDEFGARPIVRAFHRKHLVEGDILKDFCSEVLGLKDLVGDLPVVRENESMSAEAVFSLISYGSILQKNGLKIDEAPAKNIRRSIRSFKDPDNLYSPLHLKPEVVETIRTAAVEYVWLRDNYGIEFEELDYDRIDEKNVEKLKEYVDLSDIFDVDTDKLASFIIQFMGEAAIDRPIEKARNLFGQKSGPLSRILGN